MLYYTLALPLPPTGPAPGRSAVLNDPVLNDAPIGKRVRRRRSWYRRRLRMRRILVAVVVGTAIAGACWQNAARYFSLPTLHASQVLPGSFWMRGNVRKNLALDGGAVLQAREVSRAGSQESIPTR